MLSDAEQRRLTEIERALRSEDPHFVQRFRSDGRYGPHTWCGMTASLWLIVAALGMALAVLAASTAIATIALIPAGVSAGLWLADLSRPRNRRGPTHL